MEPLGQKYFYYSNPILTVPRPLQTTGRLEKRINVGGTTDGFSLISYFVLDYSFTRIETGFELKNPSGLDQNRPVPR